MTIPRGDPAAANLPRANSYDDVDGKYMIIMVQW